MAAGMAMFLIGLWSLWLRTRRRMYEQRCSCARWPRSARPGWSVASRAGSTEVGRQPYTIYGVLRTADSVSPVATEAVAASLVAFVVVYFAVFGAGAFYMLRLMREPPKPASPNRRERTDARAGHHARRCLLHLSRMLRRGRPQAG